MKNSETPASAAAYTGHVKNGVVVFDAQIDLRDGQAVRVEPVIPTAPSPVPSEQQERVRQLQQLFAQWAEEDAHLSEEEADQVQKALEQRLRVQFRSTELD